MFVEELNPAQCAAATDPGSLLVVAGAGTGKTKTLVARVAHLIESGVTPERILLLTFTRRAAAEMLSRVAGQVGDRSAGQVWGGTFHAVANRLLRQYGEVAGLPPSFTVLDQGDAAELFSMVRRQGSYAESGRRFPKAETIASIYSRVVNAQQRLGDVLDRDYPWCVDHQEALSAIFTDYTTTKRAHAVLDFDDLLLFWRGLCASRAGPALREMFDHILIDEYQDTNPLQVDIVRGMSRPADDARPTRVCAVGDDAQAIYGFRSATVENMWAFSEQFATDRVVSLEQNYRSTPSILAVANAVLGHDANRATGATRFDKVLWSDRSVGPRPRLLTARDDGDEASAVADAVLDARERGIDLRQQAVLFRAGHHSDRLELELIRRDIPYVKYGGLKYLEAAHVKDLMALLRVLDNPGDVLAWQRVLKGLDGVGPATLRRLNAELGLDNTDEPTNDGPHPALRRFLDGGFAVPAPAREQVAELRSAWQDCARADSPSVEIERLKQFCSIVFPNRYDNAPARLADIDQLAATARSYSQRSRFLTELTLDPPSKTSERAGPPHLDDDWLTLSTIHSAKGMEWRAVHLIHAADGSLPSDMALGDEGGMAEELRLLYVAVTRAKDELTISYPLRFHVHRQSLDDRHVYSQPSRFLEGTREHLDEVTTPAGLGNDLQLGLSPGEQIDLSHEVDVGLHSLWD